jgi:predicted 3-demethylubiquinone-9 3-methyltransferase (glyoxalase superfamily)
MSEDGQKSRCRWLKNKFGVSWQIVPAALAPMPRDPNPAKLRRVMGALLQIDNMDLGRPEQA